MLIVILSVLGALAVGAALSYQMGKIAGRRFADAIIKAGQASAKGRRT